MISRDGLSWHRQYGLVQAALRNLTFSLIIKISSNNGDVQHVVTEIFTPCISRSRRSHWENLNPASGRPMSSAYAKLERQWDLQPGHKDLSQDKALTTDEELKELAGRSQEA